MYYVYKVNAVSSVLIKLTRIRAIWYYRNFVFRILFLFGLEILKYFFIVINNSNLSRNRLFRSLSPSKKEFGNSLYKGFIIVNNIDSEIDFIS